MLLGDKGTAISKGEGFANYSSIQTFHGAFTKKDRCVLFTDHLVVPGRHRFEWSKNLHFFGLPFLQLRKLQFTCEHHCWNIGFIEISIWFKICLMAVETLKQLKVNLKWKQTTSVLLIYSDNSIAFEKETQMNETLEPGPLNTTKVPQGTLPACTARITMKLLMIATPSNHFITTKEKPLRFV